MKYYKNFSLKKYNSFGLDSIAKEIWFPESNTELRKIIIKLKEQKYEVLAEGTNVLLSPKIDKVICLKRLPKFLEFDSTGCSISANYSTSSFILQAIKHNFKGIEGLIGIPGTVGGAITMNSGSGKYCISDYIYLITTISYDGQIYVYPKSCLSFGRRESILQYNKQIVISADFIFEKGERKCDCEIKQIKNYRKTFPKGYSVGGIFKNWYALKPYEKEIRDIKSSNLRVSKYLNVIINNGYATFQETIDFINKIREIVKEPLELEVKILG